MLKKVFWIYIVLYSLGVIYIIIDGLINKQNSYGVDVITYLFVLIFFLPPLVIALRLLKKRVHILWTIISLLIIALPVLGILKFNEMNLETIGKAFIFLPMVIALFYFMFKKTEKLNTED